MLPIIGVPETIRRGLTPYRPLFCRDEGFEHVSRYVTGLMLSPNKTLQGIYNVQVWGEAEKPSRRAMHEAVFEAGWDADGLLPLHRQVVAPAPRGRGREVLSLDWTYTHHERGPKMGGVKKAWDHVERRMAPYQTIVTAVIANRERLDGLEVIVQQPDRHEEEVAYLQETVQESYAQMEAARGRCLELFHHLLHRLGYKKRTEIALEVVQQLEQEGHFPQAHYAFDNGVLTLALTRGIENAGKPWVSEVECSRHIQWQGQWRRVDAVAAELRRDHPESVRLVRVRCRNGDTQQRWAFTKVVRLKRYGRTRLVMVHEHEDLSDAPRFLLTDALHWERGRVLETWSERWASEIFHEFAKQVTGLEAAQVRKEEAVQRHCRLSGVAQSLVQQAPASGATSERFAFAQGESTCGQKCYTIAREAWSALLRLVASLLARGHKCEDILELLLPA
ncbi:MAG: hypothetical protein JO249_16540 [Acidobacteria bacterium]|nr:hypothetical protein [Acidobacteriota bacterium]